MRSPLHDQHVRLGAKLGDFSGWEMPLEYSGTLAEHAAVRERVGLFDVSHMGKVRLHGEGAANFMNAILTNDLHRIGPGQAQYSLLCNESGGVIDDLIVYRWSDDELFCVPNAGNASAVIEVLRSLAPNEVSIDDHHADHGIIAVQGPASSAVLDAAGLPSGHDYMTMVSADLDGARVAKADGPGVALDASDRFDGGSDSVDRHAVTVPPSPAKHQEANNDTYEDAEPPGVRRHEPPKEGGLPGARGTQLGVEALAQKVARTVNLQEGREHLHVEGQPCPNCRWCGRQASFQSRPKWLDLGQIYTPPWGERSS